MVTLGDCLGLKKSCSDKTPQIVVAVLGQAAAGVSQALDAAVNVLQAVREKEKKGARPVPCGREGHGAQGGRTVLAGPGDGDVLLYCVMKAGIHRGTMGIVSSQMRQSTPAPSSGKDGGA